MNGNLCTRGHQRPAGTRMQLCKLWHLQLWPLLILPNTFCAKNSESNVMERFKQEGSRGRHYSGREDESQGGKRKKERTIRNLVPQLLPNYTAPELPPASSVGCGMASVACMYRGGCGLALKQYKLTCNDLVHGVTNKCSRNCRHALIALISTLEGERLMQCTCDDPACSLQKSRVEPCREEVTWNTRPDTVVSCTAAQWICAADPQCSTALDYYNRFCKQMFKGNKCSKRCKNSLAILLRQESATKLNTCYCDGTEDYECLTIRQNTDRLCFRKNNNKTEVQDNEVEMDESSSTCTSGTSGSQPVRSWQLVTGVAAFLVTCAATELGKAATTLWTQIQAAAQHWS